MSFLKIKDPLKRELAVKDYLATMKRIRDNQLAERTGDIELQTDLSKFFRPITETQKASTKEITEGLKPIKEGIEQLPQAINLPNYPTIEAYPSEQQKFLEGYEDTHHIGPIAKEYLTKFVGKGDVDRTYGLYDKNGKFYIGNKLVIIDEDDFIIAGKEYQGTPGLWELIVAKNPNQSIYKAEDFLDYREIMIKTNALHRENDPTNPRPKSSSSSKWYNLLRPIWGDIRAGKKTGFGLRKNKKTTTVIPSDPNALLERLDLLMASKGAGHTGVRNELVSICDELKRQRILDTKTYKKLMAIL